MSKFKVGDIITGNNHNTYGVTNKQMIKGKVIDVFEPTYGDHIRVEVLEHVTKPEQVGKSYNVNSSEFDLVVEDKTARPKQPRQAKTIKTHTPTPKGTLRGVKVEKANNGDVTFVTVQGVTIAIHGEFAISACGQNDKFDDEIGKALSLYRLVSK